MHELIIVTIIDNSDTMLIENISLNRNSRENPKHDHSVIVVKVNRQSTGLLGCIFEHPCPSPYQKKSS